jgi:hypothetical protein
MAKLSQKNKQKKKAPLPRKGAEARPTKHEPVDAEATERRRFTERLDCKVDAEAVEAAAHEMAAVHGKREALKETRRNKMAEFKEQFNALDQRMNELAETVTNSTERRDVECVELLEPGGKVVFVRTDTNEPFERRKANDEDKQDALPGVSLEPTKPSSDDGGDGDVEERGPDDDIA